MIREDVIQHKATLVGEFAFDTIKDVSVEEFVETWYRLKIVCEEMIKRGIEELERGMSHAG